MLSGVNSSTLRAAAEETARTLSDAAARLLHTTTSALDHADAVDQQAAADTASYHEQVTGLSAQIADLTAENIELRDANRSLAESNAAEIATADAAVVAVRDARDDAQTARADQGRAEVEHATEQRAMQDEVASMQAVLEQAQEAAAAAEIRSVQAADELQRVIAQAQIDQEQAVAVAYETGRGEVLATIPGLVHEAESAGQSIGRHAVLNLLGDSSSALDRQPLTLVHEVLTDALTEDTLPAGSPVLRLEQTS